MSEFEQSRWMVPKLEVKQKGLSMAKKLFVGGLPWSTTSEELHALFEPHGTVVNAFIVKDRETGRSKGFGFVEMDDGAEEAIAALEGSDLGGRSIRVDLARERESRD